MFFLFLFVLFFLPANGQKNSTNVHFLWSQSHIITCNTCHSCHTRQSCHVCQAYHTCLTEITNHNLFYCIIRCGNFKAHFTQDDLPSLQGMSFNTITAWKNKEKSLSVLLCLSPLIILNLDRTSSESLYNRNVTRQCPANNARVIQMHQSVASIELRTVP